MNADDWNAIYQEDGGKNLPKENSDVLTASCGFIYGWSILQGSFNQGKFYNVNGEELYPSHWMYIIFPGAD